MSTSASQLRRLALKFERGADDVAKTVTVTRGGTRVSARRAVFYTQEDVSFASTGVTIAGTLLRPVTPGPHPALVMIHGSGAVTRDALRPSADHFARNGVAVLITDKRGTGQLKFEVARTGEGWPRLQTLMGDAADAAWLTYTNPPASLESLRWHWDHVFGHDPIPVLARLEIPMLVLYGELDSIVPPRVHRKRMDEALRTAGRHNVTIKVFQKANHGFFEAITGGRLEHARLASFVDGYFEERTAWVLATVQGAQPRGLAESQD